MRISVRDATLADLSSITDIHNYYVVHTHVTFDVEPWRTEERLSWFEEHSGKGRYRMLVACDEGGTILGYTCTGRFRSKEAYDTTVEATIACRPDRIGAGIGKRLYDALFEAIADQDINRVVAAIAQPNPASNALHERFGFKPIGLFTEVGRKLGKYWDVLWMERALRP
jgi:phosphinothricin acetyltransferase